MKQYFLALISVTFLAFSTLSNAAVYDFAAEGNEHEAGYALFDSDNHSIANPAHDTLDMPGGLQISASNGGALPSVPFGSAPGATSNYFAYMDGNWKQDAGLGVCKIDTNSCGSDDNQMEGEYVHMLFDTVVNILSLDITGNHEAVATGTEFWYSLDQGSNWSMIDIGGQVIDGLDVMAGWLTNTLDYTIKGGPNDGEMYLAAMEISPVPVPAAFWLFGTALFGFIAYSRRIKV